MNDTKYLGVVEIGGYETYILPLDKAMQLIKLLSETENVTINYDYTLITKITRVNLMLKLLPANIYNEAKAAKILQGDI